MTASDLFLPAPTPVDPAPPVRCTITENPFDLDPAQLFGVARRLNPRRSALFVSLVLGKHVPAPPSIVSLAGTALALLVAQSLGAEAADHGLDSLDSLDGLDGSLRHLFSDPVAAGSFVERVRRDPRPTDPVVVIGFCETATALGHLVRDGLLDAPYLQTTRALLDEAPLLGFEEEHSHATAHRLYSRDPSVLSGDETIVLVDDELTTGRTALNTIAALHAHGRHRRYLVATLLDWRDAEARASFAAAEVQLGVRIEVVALLRGEIDGVLADGSSPIEADDDQIVDGPGEVLHHDVRLPVPQTARLGWGAAEQAELEEELASAVGPLVDACGRGPVLCVGTEELMYVPLRLAEQLAEQLAEHLADRARAEVRFQSTTRSPVVVADVEGYPVRHGCRFPHPDEPDRLSRLHNLEPGTYTDVYVFFEGTPAASAIAPLVGKLGAGAERLHVVHLVEQPKGET